MKLNTAIILVVLTFAVCVCPVQAIQCYACSRNDGCGAPFKPSSVGQQTCSLGCETFITTIAGVQYYDRACAVNTLTLDLTGVESIYGTKCTTDLCNTYQQSRINSGAAVNHFAIWTLLSTLIVTKMWWLTRCVSDSLNTCQTLTRITALQAIDNAKYN